MTTAGIAHLRIKLDDVEPAVVRRVEVPLTSRLDRLHLVLQAAMGWTNSHLYEIRARMLAGGYPIQTSETDRSMPARPGSSMSLRMSAPDRSNTFMTSVTAGPRSGRNQRCQRKGRSSELSGSTCCEPDGRHNHALLKTAHELRDALVAESQRADFFRNEADKLCATSLDLLKDCERLAAENAVRRAELDRVKHDNRILAEQIPPLVTDDDF